MDTNWFNKLIGLLNVQTNSENEKLMVLYLDKELKKLKLEYVIDAVGNILVTKGKAKTYPCVVSHMDTVHSFVDDFKVGRDIDDKDILFALNGKQRVGVGGDDKCGIFGCLFLLKNIPQIKVVFFSREEAGCKGSLGINKKFFSDCRYLIELDRNGSRDFIQTYWGDKTISHEFSSEIGLIKKAHRYKNTTGTVTDVMKLWYNKVGISCINLSCGYYRPHTAYEYISISSLWNSVKFTEAIINTLQPKRYTSLPPKPTTTTVSYAYNSNYKSKYDKCCKCGAWKKETLLYEIKGSKRGEMLCYYCKYPQKTTASTSKNIVKCGICEGTIPKDRYRKITQGMTVCGVCAVHLDEYTPDKEGEIILFACFECGKTTNEMEKGHSLKYRTDGHLYCTACMSILFAAKKEPESCFVCNKVIPKDHKIIERFGVRVCEDCACPSDIEITEDKERFNGESNFVN
jgi:putative aminopeptidase FrvX